MENAEDRSYEILELRKSRGFERSSNSVEENETNQGRRGTSIMREEMISDRDNGGEKMIIGGRADR